MSEKTRGLVRGIAATKLINENLKLNGSGATTMAVDGSTPKKFYYSHATLPVTITSMKAVITGATAALLADAFGAISALSKITPIV